MKITTDWKLNIKSKEVEDKVSKATKQGLTDVVTDIANDAIKLAPVLTGNLRRSIAYEVGPGGEVAKKESEGAVFSSCGYGGFQETGTRFAPAHPFLKPALDMNIHKLPNQIKAHLT